MQASIDGLDLKATFGISIKSGLADFLTLPKRKASVQHDWPEEEGIDIDLTDPHYEARQFKLTMNLIASGLDDFKTKYYGFFTQIKSLGGHELYITDIDQTFYIYYMEQANVKKLTSSLQQAEVGLEFDITFGESNPDDNLPVTYIITDTGAFIIA